nr:MAG: E2 protein [Hydrurga leptonyx papillomavirus 1]
MMETLSQRLGVLQDQMMDLIEQQASQLSAQVKYWYLQRQEQALLYYARQKGLSKLGHSAVPAMQVSKARAETAIQMHLQLSSLQESEFGKLPWTMKETSSERYQANPSCTFKKKGTQVTVHYDNKPDNAVEYTLWLDIYEQTDGAWTKSAGGADEKGLYVSRDGIKDYYEDFQKDSCRYGTTGEWTVFCGSQTFYFPNSSGSGKQPISEVADAAKSTSAPNTQRSLETPTPQPLGSGERVCAKEVELDRPRGGQGKLPSSRGRKRPGEPLERDPEWDWEPPPVLHGASWGRPQPYKVARRGWRHQVLLQQQQQQLQLQQQQQQQLQLQQQLQQQQQQLQPSQRCSSAAEHPNTTPAAASALLPCVVLSGRANPLKCLRYRLWQKYGGLVEDITTTWMWAKRGKKTGDSQICLVFRTEDLRTTFLSKVCLPKGVCASLGLLPY